MSNLLIHAERELRIAGWYDEDSDYGGLIPKAVLSLMKVFADDGHSGGSASIVTYLFERLSRFQPLTPLTGDDTEWNIIEYDEHMEAQNTRCSSVFRRADGTAYHSAARVFEEPDGCRFTGNLTKEGFGSSSVDISFPYTPKVEIVKVPKQ